MRNPSLHIVIYLIISAGVACTMLKKESDWAWYKPDSSDYDFNTDRAVCFDQTGVAYGRISAFSGVAYENCLVSRGWRKVPKVQYPSSPSLPTSVEPSSDYQKRKDGFIDLAKMALKSGICQSVV